MKIHVDIVDVQEEVVKMDLTVFGKTITLKDYHCKNILLEPLYAKSVKKPYANIYVRIQNVCNAKCKFCEFTGENGSL